MFLDDKPQGEVTEAPAKITKLSQAIRAGAKLRPQRTGAYFHEGKSCALGAAYEGMYGYIDDTTAMIATWVVQHFRLRESLVQEVIIRNDKMLHTREQIADWLEAHGW